MNSIVEWNRATDIGDWKGKLGTAEAINFMGNDMRLNCISKHVM